MVERVGAVKWQGNRGLPYGAWLDQLPIRPFCNMDHGGEYAAQLIDLPLHVPIEDSEYYGFRATAADLLFSGPALWRAISEEEKNSLQRDSVLWRETCAERTNKMHVMIDDKPMEFMSYICCSYATREDSAANRNPVWFYVLRQVPTPEEMKELAPFCECADCKPTLFSRADFHCIKRGSTDYRLAYTARQAKKRAESGGRWCTLM